MAFFKRKSRRDHEWGWDPAAAGLTDEQLWALLANGIYFKAVAPRMDTLGGGLTNADWKTGLKEWWGVKNKKQFVELVDWMRKEGHRADWVNNGDDEGDEKFAWDYCRMITVAGGAALADVIEDKHAWDLVLEAGDFLAGRFDSWESLGTNYISGRLLWLDDLGKWGATADLQDPTQALFEGVKDMLLSDSDSPWGRVAWDRSGGVKIDGQST